MTGAGASGARHDGGTDLLWSAGAMLVAALLSTPILILATQIGGDTEGVFAHLAATVLPRYLVNTLLLCLGVGFGSAFLGAGTAWLVTAFRFPGASLLRWALMLPLAIPAYLSAYALTDLLQFSGPVQHALREVTGWGPGDYYFPPIRSLGGAIWILSFGLYPYVYLAARAAFLEQSVAVLEVGRTLGAGGWQRLRRLALPLARPSIVAGLSLVLMETVAEFGAVEYCAVDTLATGIYRTWRVYGLTPAAQLATFLLLFVLLLIALESASRRARRFYGLTTTRRTFTAQRLDGWRGWGAAALCALPVLLGFALPSVIFIRLTIAGGDARAASFWRLGGNSLLLAAGACTLAVLLALIIAYGRRLHPNRWVRAAARVAGSGYAVPGGVIAIGLLIFVGALDRGALAIAGRLGLASTGPWLGGTVVALLLAYQTRFLALPLNMVGAGLTRIRPTIDDAARNLGAGPGRVLRAIHLPLLRGSLLGGMLLVFVDVIKELPATLILRPFDFDTLAVRVYQLASDERLAEASTGALAIILVGLVPVIWISRLIDGAPPVETALEDR